MKSAALACEQASDSAALKTREAVGRRGWDPGVLGPGGGGPGVHIS